MTSTTSRPIENVWDYPRPPALELTDRRLRVYSGDTLIADTEHGKQKGWRVLETSHPPTYYLPLSSIVDPNVLSKNPKSSFCEWKGPATYHDVTVDGNKIVARCWSYDKPTEKFEPIKGCIAWYASSFRCVVDDEDVEAQAGDFYGGWKTSEITGGKKGSKDRLGLGDGEIAVYDEEQIGRYEN